MLRLTVCCLLLGAALAKPAEKTTDASEKLDNHATFSTSGEVVHSEPTAIEVDSNTLSEDPQPLPLPSTNFTDVPESDGTPAAPQTEYYVLQPGTFYFTSPWYPSNYPNNAYFHYVFRGYSYQQLSVVCSPFSLQSNHSCLYDWLSFNGERFCGYGIVRYWGTRISAEFRSDGYYNTYGGFHCTISVPNY